MLSSDVTYKTVDVPIENSDETRKMDVAEISYPDGKVVAYPADMKSPETGKPYSDLFPEKYKAFKDGGADPDHVARLKQEIAQRQAELDAMRRAPDDEDDPARMEQPATIQPPVAEPGPSAIRPEPAPIAPRVAPANSIPAPVSPVGPKAAQPAKGPA